jgi:hypothetical protein
MKLRQEAVKKFQHACVPRGCPYGRMQIEIEGMINTPSNLICTNTLDQEFFQ